MPIKQALGLAHVHLGLEHVQTGAQAHFEIGLGDAQLFAQAGQAVAHAAGVLTGFQVFQERRLHLLGHVQLGLAQRGLVAVGLSNLRSQLLKTKRNTIILDAYNANPSSMQVAISNFGEMRVDNKLLIIGEMRELGAISEESHKNIVELMKKNNFPRVFLVGSSFESIANNYTFTLFLPDTY